MAGLGSSLTCLTVLLAVVVVTTRNPFYQHHAQAEETDWTAADCKDVIK